MKVFKYGVSSLSYVLKFEFMLIFGVGLKQYLVDEHFYFLIDRKVETQVKFFWYTALMTLNACLPNSLLFAFKFIMTSCLLQNFLARKYIFAAVPKLSTFLDIATTLFLTFPKFLSIN